MPQISDVTVNVASTPDPNAMTVQVSYVLTLTGTEFADGPAFSETFALWARDFDFRLDRFGVQRPPRMIRPRTGLGVPVTNPNGVSERFSFAWTQSRRSLAEDPDLSVRLPGGASRVIQNTDELSLEIKLDPFRVSAMDAVYHDFTGNFG